jgi:hypothetical protein
VRSQIAICYDPDILIELGLQLGISYARDSVQVSAPVSNNTVITGIVDVIANYSSSFGGVDIDASACYGTASGLGAGTEPEV